MRRCSVQGRVSEHHYHSPEQVSGYMRDALAVVDELDVPDDLRVAAFSKAFELLAAKHVVMEQISPGVPNMLIPKGL